MYKIWIWQAIWEQVLCKSGSESPLSQYRHETKFLSYVLKCYGHGGSQKPQFMNFSFFVAIILIDCLNLMVLSSVSPTLHRQNMCDMLSSWGRWWQEMAESPFHLKGWEHDCVQPSARVQDTPLCCCKALASPRFSFLFCMCSTLQQRCLGFSGTILVCSAGCLFIPPHGRIVSARLRL